jgi:hypothetical protein
MACLLCGYWLVPDPTWEEFELDNRRYGLIENKKG